jgi:hypothetical protein
MTYQVRELPIIEMEFSDDVTSSEFQQWLKDVEQLLNEKAKFVLIMKTAEHTNFPDDYRKIQSVWYKKNKDAFFNQCVGLVRIAHDQYDLARLNTSALHEAWKVPYFVTLTKQDALKWAVERFE